MKVQFWGREFEVGNRYFDNGLVSSNDILHDAGALRARLNEDGYLLFRKLRDEGSVLEARRQILEKLQARGVFALDTDLMEGIADPGGPRASTTSVRANEDLRLLPAVQSLFRTPEVTGMFERLLGGPAGTFDFQWLRVAAPAAESPIYSDIVFMGRGTQNLYTCWTPLGNISLDMGPSVLCAGSHKLDALHQTYWAADVDRDLIEGWFSKDPVEIVDRFGCRWSTTDFGVGDVLIFGMHILHASLANTSKRYRISVDARYQLASEPFDERWVGAPPPGHYNFWKPGIQLEPVAVSRAKWGV